ncbi:hypothetical protein BH10CYA1_BH10CYA1_55720 [soil metagenome]
MDLYSGKLPNTSSFLDDSNLRYLDQAFYLLHAIETGDLNVVEKFVQGYADKVEEFAGVVKHARDHFNCPTLTILPCAPQLVQKNACSKVIRLALFSICLDTVDYAKAISICSNRIWTTRVLGGPRQKGLVYFQPSLDDPSTLMKQIGDLYRYKTALVYKLELALESRELS